MADNILERVVSITAQHIGQSAEGLDSSTHFDTLGMDSLDMIEIVLSLEQEFGITIPDDELSTIKTIGDAVSQIQLKA